jgi:hypothetical protein
MMPGVAVQAHEVVKNERHPSFRSAERFQGSRSARHFVFGASRLVQSEEIARVHNIALLAPGQFQV